MSHGVGKQVAARWASFVARYPLLALLVGCGFLLLAWPGGKLVQPNFTWTAYFWEDDPHRVQFNAFTERFGSDETVFIAVHSPSGIFDEDSARLMVDLTEDLWQLPDVIRVDSLANFKLIETDGDLFEIDEVFPIDEALTPDFIARRKEAVVAHPNLRGSLISDDLKTAVAVAYLRPLEEGVMRNAPKVALAANAVVDKHTVGDHELHHFGVPVLTFTFMQMAMEDAPRLRRMAMVVGCVALLLLFRRVGGLAIPMAVVLATIWSTQQVQGYLGVELNTLTMGIAQVLLAVGLSVTIHVMSRFYYYAGGGLPRREAIRASLAENFVPTLLTSLTTATAFFACMTAELKIVAGYGLLGGTGTLIAWLLTYTLIGALLAYFPMWRLGSKEGEAVVSLEALHRPSDRTVAYVAWVRRFRLPIIAVSGVLALVGAIMATQVKVASDPMRSLPADHPIRSSVEFLLEEIGMLTFEVVVDSGEVDGVKDPDFLQKVDALQEFARTRPQVTSTMSLVDILKQINQVLNQGDPAAYRLADEQPIIAQQLFLYTMGLPQGVSLSDRVTIDNDALRLSVSSRIMESGEHIALAHSIEAKAEELGLNAHTTGLHDMYQKSSVPIVRSVLRSIGLAMVGVAFLLGLALRSFRQVGLAMTVNIVPILFGAGVFWITGRPVEVGTVIAFSLALGIAVDDTVHIVVHYLQHRREGCSPDLSIARVISHTVPALLTTTTILVGSVMVFIFGSYVPSFWFGVLLSVILVSALAADLTLLPALFLLADGDGEAQATAAAEAAA